MRGTCLHDAWLYGADLTKAIMIGAKLSGRNLGNVILRDADLSFAELCNAHLEDADLDGAILDRADLTGARWPENASLPPGWKRNPYLNTLQFRP
jgi:uncharacterized protein YjbI with pentapeptide repeats